METNHDVLTAQEAAAYLRVSAKRLREHTQAGQIPARIVGTRFRYSRKKLEEWMQQEEPAVKAMREKIYAD